MKREELFDDDGENRAIRAFLMFYGGQNGGQVTTQQMADFLAQAGFDARFVAPFARGTNMSLTKAAAQGWLRYLFEQEKDFVFDT